MIEAIFALSLERGGTHRYISLFADEYIGRGSLVGFDPEPEFARTRDPVCATASSIVINSILPCPRTKT